MLFGPSSSGKTYTLIGKPGQYGILPRAVEQILSQRRQQGHTELQSFGDEAPLLNVLSSQVTPQLRIAIYLNHCESTYDLLAKSKSLKVENTRIVGLQQRVIQSTETFYELVAESTAERKRLSAQLKDHDIRKRSHFVVQLTLTLDDEICQMHFVELPGSE